jgi:hypothetical protein
LSLDSNTAVLTSATNGNSNDVKMVNGDVSEAVPEEEMDAEGECLEIVSL